MGEARRVGEVIASGTRSTVYRFGSRHVVKVPSATTPDSWIRWEATYIAAVHAVGGPVPAVDDVTTVDGRVASVYERIEGSSMWSLLLAEPTRAVEAGGELADIQRRLAALPAPMVLPRQVDRLAGKVRRAGLPLAEAERALQALAGLADQAESTAAEWATRLCHGDLHPANVLVSENGPIVIDWFDAARGLLAGDVARTSLLLGAAGRTHATVPHLPSPPDGLLRALHDSYLARATTQFGLDAATVDAWRRVEAVARLAEGLPPGELLAVWSPD